MDPACSRSTPIQLQSNPNPNRPPAPTSTVTFTQVLTLTPRRSRRPRRSHHSHLRPYVLTLTLTLTRSRHSHHRQWAWPWRRRWRRRSRSHSWSACLRAWCGAVSKASWLSLRPASWCSGGFVQHQLMPQAARLRASASLGQPRPRSRDGRAGRRYRPYFRPRCRGSRWSFSLPSLASSAPAWSDSASLCHPRPASASFGQPSASLGHPRPDSASACFCGLAEVEACLATHGSRRPPPCARRQPSASE